MWHPWHWDIPAADTVSLDWSCHSNAKWLHPKAGFLWAVSKRLPGGPIKRYKDSLKENLKKCGFQPNTLCEEPLDRDSWRSQCKEAMQQMFQGLHSPNWTLCRRKHSPMMLQSVVLEQSMMTITLVGAPLLTRQSCVISVFSYSIEYFIPMFQRKFWFSLRSIDWGPYQRYNWLCRACAAPGSVTVPSLSSRHVHATVWLT